TNPGQLNIANASVVFLGGALTNAGTLTWTGSTNFDFDGGTLSNQAGATVDLKPTAGSILVLGGTTTQIVNAGTFKKSGGAATTTVNVPLSNSGTVQGLAGTLNLSGGGSHTGAFN